MGLLSCLVFSLSSHQPLLLDELFYHYLPLSPGFDLFHSLNADVSSPLFSPLDLIPNVLHLRPPHTFAFLLSLSFSSSIPSLSLPLSRPSPSHLTPISGCPGSRISPVMETGCGSTVLFQRFFSVKSQSALCFCVGIIQS